MRLIKIMTLVVSMLLVVSCYTTMELSHPDFIPTYLTKTYPYSSDKCFKATANVLKELGVELEEFDPNNKRLVTQRYVCLSSYVQGNPTGGGMVTRFYHRYYLEFIGNDSSCTVKAYKYKIWIGHKDLESINATWGKENIWDPFFKSIETELKDM